MQEARFLNFAAQGYLLAKDLKGAAKRRAAIQAELESASAQALFQDMAEALHEELAVGLSHSSRASGPCSKCFPQPTSRLIKAPYVRCTLAR